MSDILKKYQAILIISSIIFIFIAFFGCGSNPTERVNPEVSGLVAPDSVSSSDSIGMKYFSVTVSDPQGLENVDKVFIVLELPAGTLSDDTLFMYDNGLSDDPFANDGVYSYILTELDIFIQNGDYIFHFSAVDSDGNQANTIDKTIIVDVFPNPYIYDLVAPEIIPLGFPDTLDLFLSIRDLQGLDDIEAVYFTIEKPDSSLYPDTLFMYDDGQACDDVAGDGIYSYCLTGPDTTSGDYTYHFSARDMAGNQANAIDHIITIDDISDNPYVYNLIAPDSMLRGSPELAYLFLNVWDPQGLANIHQVYFIVRRPDSTTSGIGHLMFDRGELDTNGDSVALDGIYTQGIQMEDTANTQLGEYIFYFTAVDVDSNMSNTIPHIITAYDSTSLMSNRAKYVEYNSDILNNAPSVNKISRSEIRW